MSGYKYSSHIYGEFIEPYCLFRFIPSLKELLEHVIVALEAVGLKVIQHSAENLHLAAVLQVTEEALEAHVGLGGDGLGDMREGLQVGRESIVLNLDTGFCGLA